MKLPSSPIVLIAFGFTMGLIVGALVCGPFLPPTVRDPWLATYSGLIGAVMTGLAGLAVVVQISSSERHHRQVLEAQFHRDLDSWVKSDGNLAHIAEQSETQARATVAGFWKLNPSLQEDLSGAADSIEIPTSYRLPELAFKDLFWTDNSSVLIQGATPGTAAAFLDLLTANNIADNQISNATGKLLPTHMQSKDIGHKGAQMYLRYMDRVIQAADQTRRFAEASKPQMK